MYKVVINTDSYKKLDRYQYRLEVGTINDFMAALNGWNAVEEDIQTLTWRIHTFAHNFISDNWNDEKQWYSGKYIEWVRKPESKLTYFDKTFGIERTSTIAVYGFAQGYFDVTNVLRELEEKGEVKILFKQCYDTFKWGCNDFKHCPDIRMYLGNFDGCYMQITKINTMIK